MFRRQNTTKAEKTKYVSPGETALGSKNEVLISTPLGSCVAVIIFDKITKIGGMTHIMLPGKSLKNSKVGNNKFALDAIDNLLRLMHEAGVLTENMEICLAGGANVLKKPNDTIARDVVKSVLDIVEKKKLKIKAASLGGYARRGASLNIATGTVYYTLGDSNEKILWEFGKEKEIQIRNEK